MKLIFPYNHPAASDTFSTQSTEGKSFDSSLPLSEITWLFFPRGESASNDNQTVRRGIMDFLLSLWANQRPQHANCFAETRLVWGWRQNKRGRTKIVISRLKGKAFPDWMCNHNAFLWCFNRQLLLSILVPPFTFSAKSYTARPCWLPNCFGRTFYYFPFGKARRLLRLAFAIGRGLSEESPSQVMRVGGGERCSFLITCDWNCTQF